jgi:hypothetical protein
MREPAPIPDQLTTHEPDLFEFLDRHAVPRPTTGGRVRWLLDAEDLHELVALVVRRGGGHRLRLVPQPTPKPAPKVYRVPIEDGEGDRYLCAGDECGHGL